LLLTLKYENAFISFWNKAFLLQINTNFKELVFFARSSEAIAGGLAFPQVTDARRGIEPQTAQTRQTASLCLLAYSHSGATSIP
jgi:hypothetical protein